MYSRGATQIDGNAAQLDSLTRKTALATFRSPMQAQRRVHRSRTGLHQPPALFNRPARLLIPFQRQRYLNSVYCSLPESVTNYN